MIKLEDVIHFYLPCAIKTNTGSNLDMVGVRHDAFNGVHEIVVLNGNMRHGMSFGDFKPILRKLSDMTEEENSEYARRRQQKGYMPEVHADNTRWLLSKHIDLFGLIESGQALPASTEKK